MPTQVGSHADEEGMRSAPAGTALDLSNPDPNTSRNAGSLWAGTPAAAGASGPEGVGHHAGSGQGQGSLWASTPAAAGAADSTPVGAKAGHAQSGGSLVGSLLGFLWASKPAGAAAPATGVVEQGPPQAAGSLWASTPAATDAPSASTGGTEPRSVQDGESPGASSLWAGTPSGGSAEAACETDGAGGGGVSRGGLFEGTPAGASQGGSGERGMEGGSRGELAAACERGHLLDFVRDGASMLIRSTVLQVICCLV